MSGYQKNGYNSDQVSVDSQDDHNYEVEHLATFAVSPQAGLVYPSDGMRRLLQMEKTSGIWTQKLYLRLEANWVVIIDYENGEIIEKFPIHLIRDPTAFTSSDPKEIYDNIYVFIVGEDPVTQNPPEMHIFQCVRVKATALVEEMKGFMTGVKKGGIPPPPNAPPPEPPGSGRDSVPPFGQAGDHRADDASSTSSEKYERDVAVLNRCFDDIERFIARLQHAAAASRELDRRRRSRKSKKKDHGDGIIAVRARAPPEKDFVDTLQKFKLSFNLLAKLKAHIHDPNAPELVHFLFTPLALIIDASRDAQLEPNLPARVISPLLTVEAVELLTNCLTSKETELWHSLGEAWQVPREKWKGYVSPYHPVFADGWAPEYPLTDEKERPNERYFYDSERSVPSPLRRERSETPPSDYRTSNRPGSDVSADSGDRGGIEDMSERRRRVWIDELRKRDARIVQVTYPRTANNDKELTVVRGELLEVIDDSKNWWKCRNSRGQIAHVPHTIITPFLLEDEAFLPYQQDSRPGPSSDWVKRERQGKKDFFDESLSEDEDGLPKSSSRQKVAHVIKSTPIKETSPPPPPPPVVNRRQVPESSDEESGVNERMSSASSQENLLDELKSTLKRDSGIGLKIRKTQTAYLDHRSSPAEVQKFLTTKKFSEEQRRKFNGYSGKDLFNMNKLDFEKKLGKVEGHRLDSYITIQKNVTEYKTMRTSELKQALARARVRSGVSRSPSPVRNPRPAILPQPKKLFEYEVDSDSSSSNPMRHNGYASSTPSSPLPPPPENIRNALKSLDDELNTHQSSQKKTGNNNNNNRGKVSKQNSQPVRAKVPDPPAAIRQPPSSKNEYRQASVANGFDESRERGMSPKKPGKVQAPRREEKREKVPPAPNMDFSDSDAEPPAPGTLREQILKQRKRLGSAK
ncbi:epidermal growth factor receptor kinase substrate 8-like [Artemia franciscana]|uniref:SH3 domain-containing protein n=1 Tax=Artemia franciscana TaxID=6661 RepID=A0AA88IBL8_ARTSF|nr:hypothetical protein QYM36_001488 [Artemia franciscana]